MEVIGATKRSWSDQLTPPAGAWDEHHGMATRLGKMSKAACAIMNELHEMQLDLQMQTQQRMMQNLQVTDSQSTAASSSGCVRIGGSSDPIDADVASRQTAKCSHPKCSFECHQAPHCSFAGFCCGRCRACFGDEGAPACVVHGKKCSAVVWSPEIQLTQETQVDLSEETKVDLCETEVDDLRLKIRRCK